MWLRDCHVPLQRALQVVTEGPGKVLGAALGPRLGRTGRLQVGGLADVCVFDPQADWTVQADALVSQGKHTPFSGYELPGRVRCTLVGGRVAYQVG